MNAVFMKLLLYDWVVIPKNECIFLRLVLDDTELGIYIILHLVFVSVQMVWSDVHHYSDISMEFIHVVQLEAAKFNHIIIIVVFCNLES